jgi:outer membrane protein OmpA-like peptidoglycan-associated protein
MVMKRAVMIGLALAALALTVGFGWLFYERNRDLERRLGEMHLETEQARADARQSARDLAKALELAAAERRTAEQAAGNAAAAAEARARAEELVGVAEEEKLRAHQELQQSQQQLAELRKRREQELNRMHEALRGIAATRRTASGMVIELANDSFYFDFDKADLRPQNREVLSRIAGVLLASNGYRLSIHGHTDDVGDEQYNQRLSERRAESVAEYLKSAGIDPGVIDTTGYGKASPRVKGQTREARQKNRRVEIAIVDSVIEYRGEVAGKS